MGQRSDQWTGTARDISRRQVQDRPRPCFQTCEQSRSQAGQDQNLSLWPCTDDNLQNTDGALMRVAILSCAVLACSVAIAGAQTEQHSSSQSTTTRSQGGAFSMGASKCHGPMNVSSDNFEGDMQTKVGTY